MSATEIIFLVEQDPEGGYTAQALQESIFTEAEDLETLKVMLLMRSTFSSSGHYHQG